MEHKLETDNLEDALSVVGWSHRLVELYARKGDTVVDTTCGNGRDTEFLAGLVGPAGRVLACDIQEEAVQRTGLLLKDSTNVTITCFDHARISEFVPASACRPIKAFMFNLGFLPGSKSNVTTKTSGTLSGLQSALDLLAEGGIITAVCYPGHPGGNEEGQAVTRWAEALPTETFGTVILRLPGQKKAPFLVAVIRRMPSWKR